MAGEGAVQILEQTVQIAHGNAASGCHVLWIQFTVTEVGGDEILDFQQLRLAHTALIAEQHAGILFHHLGKQLQQKIVVIRGLLRVQMAVEQFLPEQNHVLCQQLACACVAVKH